VLGYDVYKECLDEAHAAGRALGPVLGPYHPYVVEVAERLCALSGMDEVTFHMSGTEAVMQAVRLARYHTRRRYVVRFCGAYHGFWGDVQPGPGNPMPARDTLTLADMSEKTLEVLRTRDDVACVLVNPLQALHPNRPAPSDSSLLDSSRSAHFDREAYRSYLVRLRDVCSERGIALIFDEVFLGFRLAKGGAQEYFGVRADLVTYGKTLGGGLPVGVVCGKAGWMRRFREGAPADICFARGTFNAHPYVIAAMRAFLVRLERPEVEAQYRGLDTRWEGRLARLEARLSAEGLPLSVAGMSSVWTVLYTRPSRYNWMFQYYLRAEGLALSWVGTGRLIFPIDLSEADFDAVTERFVRAGRRMLADGFWWSSPETTNAGLRRRVSMEMLRARLGI
jgi:glutamate-1-semialdehyde 2,1-aminomutase